MGLNPENNIKLLINHFNRIQNRMIYKLKPEHTRYLLCLPESGIGYQEVEARPVNSDIYRKFIVFNAELAIEMDSKFKTYSYTLIGEGYNLIKQVLNDAEWDEIRLADFTEKEMEEWDRIKAVSTLNSVYKTDIFIRPSVYDEDNRIDKERKELLPGSFVTSLESYTNCHVMREDPIEKYVLPVQQNLTKIYYVKHHRSAIWEEGRFLRALGRKGGGEKLSFSETAHVLIKKKKKNKIAATKADHEPC
jgi:hypothetical protein